MTQSPYEFAPLLDDFPDIRDVIHSQSDRRFDAIDFARHGFARMAPAESWGTNHRRFIDDRCNGELSDDCLADHGDASAAWRACACFALRYLLGLYQTERIIGLQFETTDAQLAGFVFLHSPRFEIF